jgi:SAM-dependent methyltransferase
MRVGHGEDGIGGETLAESPMRLHHERVLSGPALKAALPARYKAAARRAFLRVASVLNVGSRVSCPICGRHVRKFARFHGENDQCPRCGSLARHRAMLLYLRDVERMAQSERDVLHVGPSQSLRAWLSSLPRLRYLSVDRDRDVADLRADVTSLPFEDRSFDYVICSHVLEHVADDRAAIAELHRVLRPQGRALIQVPPSELEQTLEDAAVTDPNERERLFGEYDHVRLCGADYRARLEEPGFLVEELDYAAELDPAAREQYGLRAGEPFYVCVKPAA